MIHRGSIWIPKGLFPLIHAMQCEPAAPGFQQEGGLSEDNRYPPVYCHYLKSQFTKGLVINNFMEGFAFNKNFFFMSRQPKLILMS